MPTILPDPTELARLSWRDREGGAMSAIQRWSMEALIPLAAFMASDEHGRWVWFTDAEAAITEARERAVRDCIAAVEVKYAECWARSQDAPEKAEAIAALTALLPKDGA